jgi:hypothetical protein
MLSVPLGGAISAVSATLAALAIAKWAAAKRNKTKEVCYDNFGCFSLEYPWLDPPRRKIEVAPKSPDVLQPRFFLYTQTNRFGQVRISRLSVHVHVQ